MPRRDPKEPDTMEPVERRFPISAPQAADEQKWSKIQNVLVVGGTGAIWKPKRYDTFAKEAYLTNVVSFRCIDAIARAVESMREKIWKRKKDGSREEVTDHNTIELMWRPNCEQTWGELKYRQVAFGVISGNGFMERVGPDSGKNKGVYKELWAHRPDRMSMNVNPDTGVRRAYVYVGPNGQRREWRVDPINGQSDIWHMRFFNPLNDWYGAGPVEPTSREIDTSNEAMEWNKNLLQNQGRPGMIIAFKGNIGETEYNRLEKKMREKYGGPKNTGKSLIIEGEGATVTPYGWSPEEMDYIEGNRELARRIALGFGVPPMLLGIPGDNTYSNYAEAKLAFYEDTVFFYALRFCGGYSIWMFDPADRMYMEPDYDSIPALEPRRKEQFEKAEKADFLTINEKRRMCGFEDYQHAMEDAKRNDINGEPDPADVIYQQATMVPLSAEEPEPQAPEGGESGGEELPAESQPKKKPGEKPAEEGEE